MVFFKKLLNLIIPEEMRDVDPADLDLSALGEIAQTHWNLQWPIKVLWSKSRLMTSRETKARKERTFGFYQFDDHYGGGLLHVVTMARDQTRERFLRFLAHELEHAAQAEREGTLAKWSARLAQERVYHYGVRPIEIEAYEAAEHKWKFLEPVLL